jgi:hypothetical protein
VADEIKAASQVAFLGLLCFGVSMWSVPSALILGSLTMMIALEVR